MNIVNIQVCALLTYFALYSFGDIIYKMETQILYKCCMCITWYRIVRLISKGICEELYSNQYLIESPKFQPGSYYLFGNESVLYDPVQGFNVLEFPVLLRH
ncbi:hypothetical protein L1887_05963 [Cichorium endivia]|nr:hypothetical protein L1887_05963 [Cichorium endivia]